MNRKTLLLLLVALVMLAGGLYATESRMTALGYPYGFIRDNTDVHAYPATIFKYNRTFNGELSDYYYDDYYYDWSIGTNVPLKANVFGAYFNLPTGVYADDHLFWDDYYDKDTGLDISRKVQFYLGFMDKFAVGFGMSIDSASNTHEDIPSKEDYKEEMGAHYYELSGGMSTDMMDLGLKLFLTGGSWKDNSTSSYYEDERTFSGIGMNLGGRYFIQENSSLDLVALANLAFESFGNEVVYPGSSKATETDNMDQSGLLFEVGAGANYKLGSNNNIILTIKPIRFASYGTKYSNSVNSDEVKHSYSYIYIPEYTLGLESYITKWLTGRVGAKQQYDFWKHTAEGPSNYTDSEEGEYDSSFDMNLGLAFKFGKFTIDTVLEKDLLHNGPEFIGGVGDGLATQVSVNFTY